MSNYGMKISQIGKDISSVNAEDYVFSSKYGTVKTAQEPPNKTYASVTVTSGSPGSVEIAHNLGFNPLALIYSELNPGSGRWYCSVAIPGPLDNAEGGVLVDNASGQTYVDTTNLYIGYTNLTSSNKTIKYYYFIFGDSGD